MRRTRPPKIAISNRQKSLRLDLRVLRRVFREAWKAQALLAPRTILRVPSELSIAFVTDAEFARLTDRFLNHRVPTDVLTFHHGEIVVSTERAVAQAKLFGTRPAEELSLYLIHGLLHLAGYDDTNRSERRAMTRRQRQIVQAVRKKLDLSRVLR